MTLDHFLESPTRAAFLECALWASADDECLLDRFSFDDVSEDALSDMSAFVDRFLEDPATFHPIARLSLKGDDIGHNLFLSANGHGTGFWDRGYGEDGDILHERAKVCGELGLYVGDDGKIYVL